VRGFGIQDEESSAETELLDEFETLNTTERFPQGAVFQAICEARAHGSAVMMLGYKNGMPETPLKADQAGAPGSIAWFDVFKQHELRVLDRQPDPNAPDYGMPLLYQVIPSDSGAEPHPRSGQIFHASRSIRFAGNALRVPNTLAFADMTGAASHPEMGVSVLAPLLTVLGQFGISWSAVSNMLQDASVGWMKIAGLVEALASEDKAIIEDRLRTLQETKGIHRMLFLDADNNEEYGRTEVSLTDVPAVMQQIITLAAAAANVPARILFSTPPQGLNASSGNESDLTQLYNMAHDYRRRYIGPKLNRVLSAVAGRPVKVTWPSLYDSSDNEREQTRLARANASKVYWDVGAIEASDIVEGAKRGIDPEKLGKPDDDRVALTETAPGPAPAGPAGAPGKQGAAKLATKGKK
jgi:phage-related protein (TIGR01555 family)